MSNNRSGSFLGGLLVGATLGAVAGLLAAPRSGRETRYLLRKSADALPELAEDLSTSLQLQADRLSETALRSWDETLLRLREAIAAGLEATQTSQHLKADGQESWEAARRHRDTFGSVQSEARGYREAPPSNPQSSVQEVTPPGSQSQWGTRRHAGWAQSPDDSTGPHSSENQ